MSENPVSDYYANMERQPKRVAELTELEKAQLGPAAVRAMHDSEQARDSIAAKHKAAADAAAKARAVVAQLPSWIEPKAVAWDHRGQKIEVESDNPPLPLADGRVLLRLTRRRPRPTPNMTGNVGSALAKLGADSQSLEPSESRWLAVGGLIKVPAGKAVLIWVLHRPVGMTLNDADMSRGSILDSPRQYGAGYTGEMTIHFVNPPERILQLSLGHFVAVAELVDA